MFKAGALYYAIFISFFIALISGFLILQHWYHQYYVLYVQQGERLERNINSALKVVLQEPEEYGYDSIQNLDLYNDSLDMVKITKKIWGGYQLVRVDADWRVVQKSKITLCGTEILPKDAITLYLAEDGKYLSLAGNTLIKGVCYLPKLGVSKAYIEGNGFSGDKLIDGTIKESKSALPVHDAMFVTNNKILQQNASPVSDSIIEAVNLNKSRILKNSFYNKTVRINTPSWLTLENQEILGNIKISSQKGISIKKTAILQDIIVYAPKIEVEEGFTGSLQVFVTDTIMVGKNCTFRYPSLIALNETTIENPLIEIGEGSKVLGDIVLLAISEKLNVLPLCRIGLNTAVNGSIYCQGKMEIKGTIKGQLFCKSFILRTRSSLYENHLLNNTINSEQLSPYYAGSLICTSDKLFKSIKCLD